MALVQLRQIANCRQVPELPNYYVTKSGEVFSRCTTANNGRLLPKGLVHRLRPTVTSVGYPTIKSPYGTVCVHRMVLAAFVGSCPKGMQCRHLDGNAANNHLSNLCWGTQSENENDKIRHNKGNQGSRHGMAKLTEDQVKEIRKQASLGRRTVIIATEFGLCTQTINAIIRRAAWTHI